MGRRLFYSFRRTLSVKNCPRLTYKYRYYKLYMAHPHLASVTMNISYIQAQSALTSLLVRAAMVTGGPTFWLFSVFSPDPVPPPPSYLSPDC